MGFIGSTSCAQSIRDWASHCLSFPFWYRERSRARPSSYSHVKRASPPLETSHEYGSRTSVYLSRVGVSWRLSAPVGPDGQISQLTGYHIAPRRQCNMTSMTLRRVRCASRPSNNEVVV